MNVKSTRFQIKTKGFADIRNITDEANDFVRRAGIPDGLLTAFVPGSTAAITTIEYETGVLEDFKNALEKIAPADIHYEHNSRWGDGNGFSHVRSALLGPSVSVPVAGGYLALGTWQQLVLVDFDNRPRGREVVLQIIG